MDMQNQELQLAGFLLGKNLYAIDIMRIKEIILPQRIAGLPLESSMLDGMINLRGEIIPVMNLRSRFGMTLSFGGPGKLMIVSISGRSVALLVDEVEEVISIQAKDISPPPDMVDGVGAEYLVGVCLCNENLYMILNIDTLFIPAACKELWMLPHGIANEEQ